MNKSKKHSKVSIIIQTQNEQETIGSLIYEVKKLEPYEIIIIVNGSTDNTEKIATEHQCVCLIYPEPLGINVGKSIGALRAKGDILLFLDGDIVIKAEKLKLFIHAIENGYDVAFNELNWLVKRRKIIFPASLCKLALNIFLKRKDLLISSFVAIPYALSKSAVQKIGWWNLTDPPTAQTMAILQNLSIHEATKIDVVSPNRFRKATHGTKEKNSPYPISTSRIIGDHLSAISQLMEIKGIRGGFSGERVYTPLDGNSLDLCTKIKRSAIIYTEAHDEHLMANIVQLQKANVEEIIVLMEQNDLQDTKLLENQGVKVFGLPNNVQPFLYRVIGALNSSGENILFLEGDPPLTAEELLKYYTNAEKKPGVTLNNDKQFFTNIHPICSKAMVKYFLNTVLKKPSLKNNSLYSTPHVINRKVIERIGYESLMIPAVAYVKTITEGFSITSPYAIKSAEIPFEDEIIIGDHLEALHEYISIAGKRGGFNDGGKNRLLIEEIKNKEGEFKVE